MHRSKLKKFTGGKVQVDERTKPYDVKPKSCGVRTKPCGKPCDVRTKPCDVRAKPCDVRAKPCDVRTKPCDVRTKPCDERTKPCDVRAKPCDVRTKPCDERTKPHGTKNHRVSKTNGSSRDRRSDKLPKPIYSSSKTRSSSSNISQRSSKMSSSEMSRLSGGQSNSDSVELPQTNHLTENLGSDCSDVEMMDWFIHEKNHSSGYPQCDTLSVGTQGNGTSRSVSQPGSDGSQALYLILDTCSLLKAGRSLLDLPGTSYPGVGRPKCVIPWQVMQEMDLMKDNKSSNYTDNKSRSARRHLKSFQNLLQTSQRYVIFQKPAHDAEPVPGFTVDVADDRILKCSLQYTRDYPASCVFLVTEDISLMAKASICEVKSVNASDAIRFTDQLAKGGDDCEDWDREDDTQNAYGERRPAQEHGSISGSSSLSVHSHPKARLEHSSPATALSRRSLPSSDDLSPQSSLISRTSPYIRPGKHTAGRMSSTDNSTYQNVPSRASLGNSSYSSIPRVKKPAVSQSKVSPDNSGNRTSTSRINPRIYSQSYKSHVSPLSSRRRDESSPRGSCIRVQSDLNLDGIPSPKPEPHQPPCQSTSQPTRQPTNQPTRQPTHHQPIHHQPANQISDHLKQSLSYLHSTLCRVAGDCMIQAFGDTLWSQMSRPPPPWRSFLAVLQVYDNHWRAVFGYQVVSHRDKVYSILTDLIISCRGIICSQYSADWATTPNSKRLSSAAYTAELYPLAGVDPSSKPEHVEGFLRTSAAFLSEFCREEVSAEGPMAYMTDGTLKTALAKLSLMKGADVDNRVIGYVTPVFNTIESFCQRIGPGGGRHVEHTEAFNALKDFGVVYERLCDACLRESGPRSSRAQEELVAAEFVSSLSNLITKGQVTVPFHISSQDLLAFILRDANRKLLCSGFQDYSALLRNIE